MSVGSAVLVLTEIRKLWNQFKRTIATPSMLMFYTITIVGALFISLVLSTLMNFSGLAEDLIYVMNENLDVEMFFQAASLLTVMAVLGGYFGLGPADVMSAHDEYILMPSPVKPYQLFMAEYIKRIFRKMGYIVILLIIIFPLLNEMAAFSITLLIVTIAIVLFLEINYFISGIVSYVKIKLSKRIKSRLRHVVLFPMMAIPYILALPAISLSNLMFIVPSNAIVLIITESMGVLTIGINMAYAYLCIIFLFIITFLVLVNLYDYDYYELFTTAINSEGAKNRFSRLIRGEVDFSESRFRDPMMWLIIKDFWSRMRSPLQFWKYMYIVIGTAIVVWLNLAAPPELAVVKLPPQIAYSADPAFLLIMLMMLQLVSITGLLSFVDERENIYLLKVSPLKARDIVIAKYLLSIVEITFAAIPILGMLAYFLRIPSAAMLLSLSAPLILMFCATGVMIGAYVPVFTNTPETPPVPVAFSFPAINLALGGVFVMILLYAIEHDLILILVPVFTMAIVMMSLLLAIRALDHYK